MKHGKAKSSVLALAIVGTLGIGVGSAGAVVALRMNTAASNTVQPEQYGACVNKKTGLVRVLERNNLSQSVRGACKQDKSEVFISFYSGPGTRTLVKKATTPKPTPTVTPTVTPSNTPSPTPSFLCVTPTPPGSIVCKP